MECSIQVQTRECRYTRHCHSQSIRIKVELEVKVEVEPCKTIAVHCNHSEYTPTIFRIVQALAIGNYIYSLQLVTGDINRRVVSPTGLLN